MCMYIDYFYTPAFQNFAQYLTGFMRLDKIWLFVITTRYDQCISDEIKQAIYFLFIRVPSYSESYEQLIRLVWLVWMNDPGCRMQRGNLKLELKHYFYDTQSCPYSCTVLDHSMWKNGQACQNSHQSGIQMANTFVSE